MATTTYSKFNEETEALVVAEVFASGIRGKTIIVTGVNRGGIGFSTAQAFVSCHTSLKHVAHIDLPGLSIALSPHYYRSQPRQNPRLHQRLQS